jgi:hypothetical protein
MVKPNDRLSEIARRRQTYLEQLHQEANLVNRNKTDLVKSMSQFPSTQSKTNKTDEGDVIERRRKAYLDLVQQEANVERKNKALADYLKSKNQKKQYPDALNMFSNTEAIDVIQKNSEDAVSDYANEKETAFNHLKTVMNATFARNLRDQLVASDEDPNNNTGVKYIFLLNSYWNDIREEVVKRFRGGGAKPDVVFQFIVAYIDNLITKFQPKTLNIQAPQLSFSDTIQSVDEAPQQQPQAIGSLADQLQPKAFVPPSLTQLRPQIVKQQIIDFITYGYFENSVSRYKAEFKEYVNLFGGRSTKETIDTLSLFFAELYNTNGEPANSGNIPSQIYNGLIRQIEQKVTQATNKTAVRQQKAQAMQRISDANADLSGEFWERLDDSGQQQPPTPPPTGNGLKKTKKPAKKQPKKKLKYLIKGKGGTKTASTKLKPFYVDVDNLNRNILSVKYRTSRKYKINPMVISDGEKVMINEIITHQKFNDQIYAKLSNEEKRRIELLIHELKMDNDLAGYDAFASTKDLYNQLQVIRGQIEAGNNHPSLKAMSKKIISELYALRRLTKTQANQILMELA